MNKAIPFFIIYVGCIMVVADEATFSISPYEIFGSCNNTRVQNLDVGGWGECIGNFVNPTIPNPINIVSPVFNFFDTINVFKTDSIGSFIVNVFTIPITLITLILAIIFNGLKYLLVFAIKFVFVYLFYVSLGFQSILNYVDSNRDGLSNEEKIHSTFAIMIAATIITLAYGGGWINWY